MKKIKEILIKLLSSEIEQMVSCRIDQNSKKQSHMRLKTNYPIGQKIIVRSNEPGPLVVGEVFEYFQNKHNLYLVIKDSSGESHIIYDNHPAHWSEERESALNLLSWDQQYNVMTKFDNISQEEANRKNSDEYRNRN